MVMNGDEPCDFGVFSCSDNPMPSLSCVEVDSQNCTCRDGSTPFTLWLFSIAMENGLFIDDFPIEPSIYKVFSMAMLNNQMVVPTIFRQRST